jgi:hypothetical protein
LTGSGLGKKHNLHPNKRGKETQQKKRRRTEEKGRTDAFFSIA